MATIVLSLLARKGGVGRTTLTHNIAGAWTNDGARVLCMDLDGQGSLSRAIFGPQHVEQIHPAQTSAALLSGNDPEPSSIIHETEVENLWLVPAGDKLEEYAVPQPSRCGDRQFVIRNFVDEISADFDVVLIDTPPNTNVLTTWAGLVATDFVVSPVPPDAFGTQSIISVQRTLEQVSAINPSIRHLGYLLNQVQKNRVCAGYVQVVRQLHGTMVFETEITQAVAFREAVALRLPVTHCKPRSKAGKQLTQLKTELESRILQATSAARNKKGKVA